MHRVSRYDYRIIVMDFAIALVFGGAGAWLITIW